MGIRIAGVGSYVPKRTMTNHEFAARIDTSHEWIVAKTGIVERRISEPGEAPSDMGCQAAIRCLADAGVANDLLGAAKLRIECRGHAIILTYGCFRAPRLRPNGPDGASPSGQFHYYAKILS